MTAPISVDPSALAAIGVTVGGEGDAIAAAISSLDASLSGAGAMFGHDAAGVVFAQSYTASGKALLEAAGSAVNASRRVGFGVQVSAANYGHANASSTVGGATSSVPVPTAPAQFAAPGMPPPLGSGIAAPLGWALVESFVGDVWPDGNPHELRTMAGAWRSFAAAMSGVASQATASGPGLSAQQIPEAGQMAQAVGKIGGGLIDIATEAQTLATAVDGFASAVETTQNAVRSLLDQLSLSGVLETIGGIFTGHNPIDKIREVAHEVKTVLDNMKREADAASQMFSQGINALDSSTISLEAWANKEFTKVLGKDVGGALSFAFTAVVDESEGAVKFVAETAQGLEQLDPTRFAYDPAGAAKTWSAMAEGLAVVTNPALLASKIANDPSGSLDTLKDVVDWKDVEAGHPFRAVGYDAAQIGSLFIPGAGEAEPAIEGAGVAGRAASVEERAAAGAARDGVPGLAGAASKSETIATQAGRVGNELDGIKVPESSTPGAAPGESAPTGRPPVDVPAPTTDAPGGHAPVEASPPADPPRAESPGPAAPESHAPESSSPSASDSPAQTSPQGADAPPAHADAPPPPPPHASEPAQIAESDPRRPPLDSGSHESVPAAGEAPTPMADASPSGASTSGSDVAPPTGADDKVPVSVGAHGGESSEGAAGGSEHGPGGSEDSGGGSAGSSGGSRDNSGGDSGHESSDGSHRGNDDPPNSSGDANGGHDGSSDQSPDKPDSNSHDPVHSDAREGDGWHRQDDGPDRAEYGHPLADHWSSGEYPDISDSNVKNLISDPEAPYGRHIDGEPFTKEQYDERFNTLNEGRHWENYPPNDGAERGTKVSYDSLEALKRDYGDMFDRIGKESGKYLALMPDGVAANFEARGLPISTLSEPYFSYGLSADGLDAKWTIEISEVAPAFGRDGGSLQVLFKDQDGVVVTVEELKRLGILEKVVGP